jgi:hypothetical protein
MLHHAVWYILSDDSEVLTAIIIRAIALLKNNPEPGPPSTSSSFSCKPATDNIINGVKRKHSRKSKIDQTYFFRHNCTEISRMSPCDNFDAAEFLKDFDRYLEEAQNRIQFEENLEQNFFQNLKQFEIQRSGKSCNTMLHVIKN